MTEFPLNRLEESNALLLFSGRSKPQPGEPGRILCGYWKRPLCQMSEPYAGREQAWQHQEIARIDLAGGCRAGNDQPDGQ